MTESVYLSKISQFLLQKYNKPYDENMKEINKQVENVTYTKNIDEVLKVFLTDLNKLNDNDLFRLTKIKKQNVSLKPFVCNYEKNIKKIEKFNFIQDLKLVEKIIQFRKYEIIKEIKLIQYYFSVYVNIITKISKINCKISSVANPSPTDIKKNEKTIETLQEYKNILENVLKKSFIDNETFLYNNTICRYKFLTEKLNSEKKFNLYF